MFTLILTFVLLMLNLCLWIGNICNGFLLGNATIARGLTCCKNSQDIKLQESRGQLYLASGLVNDSQVCK